MNIHFIKTAIFSVVIWICYPMYAQQGDTLFVQRGKNGKIEFARFNVAENSDRKMQNDTIFLKAILQAKKEDEFRLKSSTTDELGITHKRFQQYYKGIIVENAEYLLHGKDDNIDYINGDFQDINIQSIEPIINEQRALSRALEYVGAERYKWEDFAMEKFIKQNTDNPNATYYPKGKLVVAKDYLTGSNSFKLAWKFSISSLQPYNEQMIFVDAINGEIIRNDPLIIHANSSGIAQTLYSGMQNIICDDSYPNEYRLCETRNTTQGNSVIIKTLDFSYPYAKCFSNTNTNWTLGNWIDFNQCQAALDVHWGMEKVIDYWSNVHYRNGIGGDTVLDIISYVSCNIGDYGSASWLIDGYMVYGAGDGIYTKPLTALDVIAHEIGHGITQYSSRLGYDYVGESPALNEGFSDIWGACVKNYVNLNKSLWLLGEEIYYPPYNCIRNMQNPKSNLVYNYPTSKYPDTYNGINWNPDNTPPYNNSTVLSHWFYILSVGKSGTNDHNNTYNVTGIGINKAEKIAYKTLLDLYPTADYTATRNASIQAAINLYGACSPERVSVTNAWYAVGVGNQFPYTTLNQTISNVTYTSNTTISACSITLDNVKIQNNAKLTIDAYEIFLGEGFEIDLGSELEIK